MFYWIVFSAFVIGILLKIKQYSLYFNGNITKVSIKSEYVNIAVFGIGGLYEAFGFINYQSGAYLMFMVLDFIWCILSIYMVKLIKRRENISIGVS